MKPLNIKGHAGQNVTFTCSNWAVWLADVKPYVKYLCESPCTRDIHVIIKAAPGETKNKNRIYLNNMSESLSVTFTNLQISDSNTYFCGLDIFGFDSYIEVTLKVTDGKSMLGFFLHQISHASTLVIFQ